PEAGDRDALWELLVSARSELLVERRDIARSARAADRETRNLLGLLHQDLASLGKRAPARSSGKADARRAGSGKPGRETRPPTQRRERGRRSERLAARAAEVAALREHAATRLEE